MSKLIEVGRFKPEEVLPYTMPPHPPERCFDIGNGISYCVNMRSLRYQTFNKSRKCVCCGLEGTIMLLEYSKPGKVVPGQFADFQRPHFNLYAELPGGKLILMTKDHIIPVSKGGPDHVDNLQTMCSRCNRLKSDQDISLENLKKKAEIPDPVKKSERPCRFRTRKEEVLKLTVTQKFVFIDLPNGFPARKRRELRFFCRYISLMLNPVKVTMEGTFDEKGILMMPQERDCTGKYIFFSWDELKMGYFLFIRVKPEEKVQELEMQSIGAVV